MIQGIGEEMIFCKYADHEFYERNLFLLNTAENCYLHKVNNLLRVT